MLSTLFQKKHSNQLPDSVAYNGVMLSCVWIAQKRKTFSVRWHEESQCFVIKYPSFCGYKECTEFFTKYQSRIITLYENRPYIRLYHDGDELTLYGKRYTLRLLHGKKNAVYSENDTDEIVVVSRNHTQRTIKSALSKIYAAQAVQIFSERVAYHAQRIGVTVAGITVRNQRSRWGSASATGRLNFNIRLLLAPPEVLEYVVVHELMHLRHMNHSKDFWQAVGAYFPEYAHYRKWLKDNGRELVL